ncbi:MAG: protein kinase [Bacteroidales bacterium]|nr:protein kinase [Bacteroidales bacterium]
MIGTKIFNYRITRLIGEGGMARVYEAVHEKFDKRSVAIKILDPILNANADIRHRFENEARIMASLDHPNIVKVLDYTDDSDRLAIVMEYLEGSTLSDFVKTNGALSPETASSLMLSILDAFQYAHDHGIIHRDVKPSNILLDDKLRPKIMDFGIAKLLTDNSLTRTGTQMGTPTYMSPEQVRDVKDIDHRSDIYSLGVTLYFMITGAAPYSAATLSTFDIYTKIVHEPLPALTSNIQFSSVIAKATAKDPKDRFSTCMEMADSLKLSQRTESSPVMNHDDEKTLILTDQILPPIRKETITKAKPTLTKEKKLAADKPVKPKPIASDESQKKFPIKKLILAVIAVLLIIAAFAIFKTEILSGGGKLSNSIDSVSYSFGVMEGQYLQQRFDTIHLPALKKGIMQTSRYTSIEPPDQNVMFMYSSNNLKNNNYNEKGCADFFANFGALLFKNVSGDMIHDLEGKLFYAGIEDVIAGKELKISFNDAVEYSNSFPGSKSKFASFKNSGVEKQYFADLKNRAGMTQASNGVYYEVIRDGSGAFSQHNNSVSLRYNIKNLNGEVLHVGDGSYYTIKSLLPAWRDVVQKMKKGSFFRIHVPSKAAYGVIGLDSSIKPYQTLICEVELLNFN